MPLKLGAPPFERFFIDMVFSALSGPRRRENDDIGMSNQAFDECCSGAFRQMFCNLERVHEIKSSI